MVELLGLLICGRVHIMDTRSLFSISYVRLNNCGWLCMKTSVAFPEHRTGPTNHHAKQHVILLYLVTPPLLQDLSIATQRTGGKLYQISLSSLLRNWNCCSYLHTRCSVPSLLIVGCDLFCLGWNHISQITPKITTTKSQKTYAKLS